MLNGNKLIHKTNSDIIEIVFDNAGLDTLLKSELNKNSIYLFDVDFSVGNIKDIDLKLNFSKDKKIRIWSSHSVIKEYLAFLYICYICNNNISVVFADEHSYSVSIAGSLPNEVPDLLKNEIELSKEEKEEYKQEWLSLVDANSELRIFENKKVTSVNYDYLNSFIMNVIKENEIKGELVRSNPNFIGALMGNDAGNKLTEEAWEFIVNKLGYDK